MNRKERRQYVKRFNTPQKLERYSQVLNSELRKEYEKSYEERYKDEMDQSIENFITAIMYTLHFSEITNLGKEKILEFMDDLLSTVDMFKTGEYSPEEYRSILEKEEIKIITSPRKEKEKC